MTQTKTHRSLGKTEDRGPPQISRNIYNGAFLSFKEDVWLIRESRSTNLQSLPGQQAHGRHRNVHAGEQIKDTQIGPESAAQVACGRVNGHVILRNAYSEVLLKQSWNLKMQM